MHRRTALVAAIVGAVVLGGATAAVAADRHQDNRGWSAPQPSSNRGWSTSDHHVSGGRDG